MSKSKANLGVNKLLSVKKKFKPAGALATCQDCKKGLLTDGKYCGKCAFVKGLCPICGKKTKQGSSSSHRNTNA